MSFVSSIFGSKKGSSKTEGATAPALLLPVKNELTSATKFALPSQTGPSPLTARNIDLAIRKIRGGYGARGLAGSGIAQAGESEAAGDIALKASEMEANRVAAIIQALKSAQTLGKPLPNWADILGQVAGDAGNIISAL